MKSCIFLHVERTGVNLQNRALVLGHRLLASLRLQLITAIFKHINRLASPSLSSLCAFLTVCRLLCSRILNLSLPANSFGEPRSSLTSAVCLRSVLLLTSYPPLIQIHPCLRFISSNRSDKDFLLCSLSASTRLMFDRFLVQILCLSR